MKKLKAIYTVEATLTVPMFIIAVLSLSLVFKLFGTFSYGESVVTLTAEQLSDKIAVYSSLGLNELLYNSLEREDDGILPDAGEADEFYNMLTADYRMNSWNKQYPDDERYYDNCYYSINDEELFTLAYNDMSSMYKSFEQKSRLMDKTDCEEYLRYTFNKLMIEEMGLDEFSDIKPECVGVSVFTKEDMVLATFSLEYRIDLPFSVFGREYIKSDDEITVLLFTI